MSNTPKLVFVSNTPNQNQPTLIPERYPQKDLFVCDVADAVLKDIMPQLEHPFYSLSKKPDIAIRKYQHNGNSLEIVPNVLGLPTIYDKDILIYCISQIMAKLQNGEEVSKRVHINSADLLRFTNRGTAGKDYKALETSIKRLAGVSINTTIKTGGEEQTDVFNLIDSASIRRKHGLDGRLLWCQVTLSEWVFNAIKAKEVLTLHRDYFRLRKPLEKRIYELARKHCGQQKQWKVSIDLLHKKSGSQGNIREFKRKIKRVEASNHLPDYLMQLDPLNENITFINRGTMPSDKPKSQAWTGALSPDAFEKISRLGLVEDKYFIEQEFRNWITAQQITPKNPDAMFIDFAKKRAKRK